MLITQVLLFSPDFSTVTLIGGNGESGATGSGPALSAPLNAPVGLLYTAANNSLLVTDATGIRTLQMYGSVIVVQVTVVSLLSSTSCHSLS